MGLFSSECKHCGSKEHSSSDCPHGIFSSKCKHCGSVEHSSSDCPHGIFSTKCKHCGSVDHSSDDCPQGLFSSKCKHCGSTEHSSSDCPHGIFSTKCKHCGSINHSSNDCPQGLFATRESSSDNYTSQPTTAEEDGVRAIFFFMKWGIIIAVALFIIMIAIFLAPLGLFIWYLIDKRKTQWIAVVGMLFAAYLIFDISSGGFITENMMHMQKDGSEKYLTLGYFVIFATTLGFFIDKYSSTNIPVLENGNFFTQKDIKKRRPLIAGFGILLLAIFSIFQFVSFSNNKSYSYPKNNIIQNSNSNNNSSTINSNKTSFYVINTTATKTEAKAKKEVERLKSKGYNAGYLWIPDYKSLSGANLYSVYIGPFSTQKECEKEVEKYRKIDNKAYGTLVSQENKRVEIRGVNKVKTTITNNSTNNNQTQTSNSATENSIDFSINIKNLLTAEESRNFNKIKPFYAKTIYKYWNVNNIGYSELKNQYEKSWKITLNSKNKIQNIRKINNNTYVLNTIFEFYHIKQKKNKLIHSSVRFEFDNNGKIIRVYGNE